MSDRVLPDRWWYRTAHPGRWAVAYALSSGVAVALPWVVGGADAPRVGLMFIGGAVGSLLSVAIVRSFDYLCWYVTTTLDPQPGSLGSGASSSGSSSSVAAAPGDSSSGRS